MLKVYLDLGQKSDQLDEVLTVAAAVFSPPDYLAFTDLWNQMLAQWPASAFHATDFYPGAGEFKRKTANGEIDPARLEIFTRHSKVMPDVIAKHATYICAVGFRPREYLDVASPVFKANYGLSLHSMAVQIVLILLGWWAKEKQYSDGFACFMESGDRDESEVLTTVTNMRRDAITGPHIQVRSIASVDKGRARGLEVADCVAWHWNKYYMDKFRVGKAKEPRIDLARLVVASEGKHYFSLITGDKLKYLLSGAPESRGGFSFEFEVPE